MSDAALNNTNVDGVPLAGDERAVEPADAPAQGEDREELDARLKGWFRTDRDHGAEWRDDAHGEYEMVANRQWLPEDEQRLKDQFRVPITFNQVSRLVEIVCGLEVGNRQEVRYIPRQMGDVGVNELLTDAAKWVREDCGAEDEESGAFRDAVIAGMGWTDTIPDYDHDPQGKIKISRIPPLEMRWDAGARKSNLEDARRLHRVKDIPLFEAEEMFPGKACSELHAGWAEDTAGTTGAPHDARAAPFYRPGQSPKTDQRSMVRLVETQWWEYETFYRSVDPFTGQGAEFPEDKFDVLKQRLAMMGIPEPPAVKQRRRVYRHAIIGASILEVRDGPAEGGFTWKCITGYKDENKGTWYGIVRAMADPQRMANKLLSQTLHLMNVGAKGGIMAEADAFDDIRDAEENWADPSSIVLTTPGALREGKIQPRPVAPMPAALDGLLQLSFNTIHSSAGINLELLGMVEKEQPGVLEHMRKQAGMTVLASLFDALRRYRKDQGRLLLWNIQTFITDDRLIKITGGISQRTAALFVQRGMDPAMVQKMSQSKEAQFIPFIRDPDVAEYDVVVDDTPTSPNMKERTWGVLMQMMPFLSRIQIPPQIYLKLLELSPLPESVTSEISEIAEQSMRQQQQNPAMMLAAAKAQSEGARAGLLKAQADKAQMETMLGTDAARAENFNNQVQAMEAAQRQEEIKARVENLRSQAMLNIAKAGVTQMDAQTEQMFAVLDALDKVVTWHQTAEQMKQDKQQQRAAA